jgi:hypothetical protein
MSLVTNRTASGAMLRSKDGQYTAEDLNRVESAVRCAMFIAKTILPADFNLQTKTDWDAPSLFSLSSWNVASQMERYLSNVKDICEAFAVKADLPQSMRFLTANGANQIEKALELVRIEIGKKYKAYQYSGEVYAGEEYGL